MNVDVIAGNDEAESQDFARMLREMYEAWDGPLDAEPGVHSLTRISPFDEKHRRHTCFAQVTVDGLDGGGEQVRRYVLAPYKLVRDYRLGLETDRADDVLSGDLDALRKGDVFEPPEYELLVGKPTPEDIDAADRTLEGLRDEDGKFPWDE